MVIVDSYYEVLFEDLLSKFEEASVSSFLFDKSLLYSSKSLFNF